MTVAVEITVFRERRERAGELGRRYGFAAEPLRLYLALVDAQERAFERARDDRPAADELAAYVVRVALPGVMEASVAAGTERLREAVLVRFHEGDLEGIVETWLRGEAQEGTDTFLARAATGPVFEALPELAAAFRVGEADPRRCPVCGGPPQLAVFADTGEALLTGERRLVCSRCATEWRYARMTCANCGESSGAKMPILADHDQFPHLRVDACEICRGYLITVDSHKEPHAVPLVDELVALPLDLAAQERGYTKIARNLMGFQMANFEARPMGFFTDTSICIGCKACEVACKEWNQLEGNPPKFLADSFDNTGQLDAQNWRHVRFIEQVPDNNGVVMTPTPIAGGQAWLMMSDVCKHCKNASCLEVCPTNAIMRSEFDTVFIQQDVCNGCRNCISACPYGVIGFNDKTGTAAKCTLCYDRLQASMTPACAKACPTESIKFGYVEDLQKTADQRLQTLQAQGYTKANLYGRDTSVYGGLNAFFLLMDKPEAYKLPNAQNAMLPSRNNLPGYVGGVATAIIGLVAGLVAFRNGRMNGNGNGASTTRT